MNKIGFPGFGWEFEINPIAIPNCFGIEGFDIPWYALILTTGVLLAFWMFWYLAVKKEQIISDTVFDITLIVIPVAVIGARFVYVITNWDAYKGDILKIINIRGGGIAIYGAILFGLATVLIFNKIKKTNSLSMLDALAPAVMLGQVIGRWGNFTNAEAYGWSEGVENLPWRMWVERVFIDDVYQPDLHLVHPTFFYESLWNAIGLVLILFVLYRKKKFNGEIFFAYMGWYGLGRAFIEMLRADSLYIVGELKFSVFVGLVCFVAAIIGEIVLYRRHVEEVRELSGYKSQFDSVKISVSKEEDALDQSVFEEENDETEDAEEAEELEELDDSDEEVLREQDLLDGDAEDASESTNEDETPEE